MGKRAAITKPWENRSYLNLGPWEKLNSANRGKNRGKSWEKPWEMDLNFFPHFRFFSNARSEVELDF